MSKMNNHKLLIIDAASFQHNILTSSYIAQNKLEGSNFNGKQLIHISIINDDVGFVKKWLQKNGKLPSILQTSSLKDNDGITKNIVLLAAQNGSHRCLRAFTAVFTPQQILSTDSVFENGLASGNGEVIDILASLLEDINQPLDSDQNNLAHKLVLFGLLKQVRILHRRGLSLIAKNKKGETTVSIAIHNNDENMLQELLNLVPIKQYPPQSFNEILLKDKKQCLQIIVKKNKFKQIKCNPSLLLLSAVENENIDELTNLLKSGANPNQIINKTTPLEVAIKKNNAAIVDLLIEFKADPMVKVGGLDAIQIAVQKNRINIIEILHKKGKIPSLNTYKSGNTFTSEALKKNFKPFHETSAILIECVRNLNLKIFEQKIKGFPLDELLANKENAKQPLLFYCYDMEFEAGIRLIADQVNPLAKNQMGISLAALILRSNSAQELIGYTKKYFEKAVPEILSQEVIGTNIIAIASLKGNQQIINTLVEYSDKLVKPLDLKGNYLIHLLVESNNVEGVEKLLKKDIWRQKVDVQNNKRITPLILACKNGNENIARMLLKCGANPNKADIEQLNSLHYTLMSSNHNGTFFLMLPLIKDINRASRIGLTPIMLAAIKGKDRQLKRLLQGKASIHQTNDQGIQAIYLAAKYGSFECLQTLVQAGADVNAQIIHPTSKEKSVLQTPSHAAAQSGNYKCLNYLFSKGADMNIKDCFQRTPIQAAIESKNKPIQKMIKQFPYYHNIENEWSLLKAAVKGENEHILKQFILRDFNVNIVDKEGMNMLHVAAKVDSPRCGAILIREGTSTEARDGKGNTPLHYAAESGSQALVEILPLHVINTQNNTQETPLHLACRNNHISVVITLLKVKVDFLIKNKLGMTPAQVALQNGNYQICQILASCGDISLLQNNIELLPEHIKAQYSPHLPRLLIIQKLMNGKPPTKLLLALKLMNIDALKLILMMNPSEFQIRDQNSKTPMQIAKQLGFSQAITLFTEFALTYQDTKFDKNVPVSPNKVKTQVKQKPIKKPKPFNYENVCIFLREEKKIEPSKISGFVDYISRISMQMCIMFCLGVQQSQTPELFIKKWLGLFQKLEAHPSMKKFEDTFLTYYPWDFYFITQFFDLCEKVLFNPKFSKIEPWFFKHFEPLIIKRDRSFIENGIKIFGNFCVMLDKLNLLDKLDSPPKRCISFWLNQKTYIEYCIKCLQYSKDKITQTAFLGKLPEINQIDQQMKLKNLIICSYFTNERPILQLTSISKSLDLSILRKDILNLAINKFPHELNSILKFLDALLEITSEELTDEQKLLLAKKYVESIDYKNIFDNSFIYSFLELAKSLRNHLGLWIFELLFYKKVISKQSILKTYCKICQLMLEINEVTNLEALLVKNLPNLDKVVAELNIKYLEMLKNKYPEKNLQDLKKQFLTKGQFIKSPLAVNQFQEIAAIYKKIDLEGKKLFSLASEELKQIAILRGLECKNPKNFDYKIIVLAVLREFIRRHMKILPYNTQILSVLGLINKKEVLKGRIAQVRTGEGKSTIVAILSAYMALQGYFVDIITSSEYLAKRDKQKYENFFNSLGITCSHICSNQPTKEMFNGQVLFGTNYNFEFSILRDQLYNSQLRYTQRNGVLVKRSCQAVIVDEVDSLFLDMALNSARMAIPSPFHTSWIYQLIYYYVEAQLKQQKPLAVKQVRSILLKYREGLFTETIKSYSDSKIQGWMDQAKKATEMIENKNYVVKYSKEKNQMEIIIVDFENTGRLNVGSRWSYGLHEFVEVKHKIKPKDQSLTAASMSHPAFFNQYSLIYGLTGTIGTEQERKQVQQIYKVDSFDVPPHYPSLRKRLPMVLCEQPKYFDTIFAEIEKQKKLRRPVLVLMKSINQTQRFGQYLKNKNTKHFILNETQREDEDYIISKAGLLDSVVVATNTAGRGTDIILSPESKKAGGLHVVFSFYPINSRVEDQGLGRAGRQGQNGSCQVVFHDKDEEYLKYKDFICIDIDDIEITLTRLREEKIKSLSEVRQKQSFIETIKYQILKNFCKQLNKIRGQTKKQEISPYINACINFKYQKSHLKEEINENPIMETIIKKGSSLLKLQQKGSLVEWSPFIESLLQQIPNLVMEQWGVFYSEMIQISLLEVKLYEVLISGQYQNFTKRTLADYNKDLTGKITSILRAVLSCSYEIITVKTI